MSVKDKLKKKSGAGKPGKKQEEKLPEPDQQQPEQQQEQQPGQEQEPEQQQPEQQQELETEGLEHFYIKPGSEEERKQVCRIGNKLYKVELESLPRGKTREHKFELSFFDTISKQTAEKYRAEGKIY